MNSDVFFSSFETIDEEEQVKFAHNMADIFEANMVETISGESIVSQEGFTTLQEMFGAVPLEYREGVFIAFLNILKEREISYDKEMFNAPVIH